MPRWYAGWENRSLRPPVDPSWNCPGGAWRYPVPAGFSWVLVSPQPSSPTSVPVLPFFASFESDPDLAERSEEILRAELGR
jgi:hypothetical protein